MMTKDLRPRIGETLGIRLIEVEGGRVVLKARPDLHLYNPIGMVHGGFAATMLNFACGYAVLSKLTPGMSFSTLELKMAYHKAITKDTGPVRAEGTIVTMGGRTAFTAARLVNVDGPSVRLGRVKPSGDASNLDEHEQGSAHRHASPERAQDLSPSSRRTDRSSILSGGATPIQGASAPIHRAAEKEGGSGN